MTINETGLYLDFTNVFFLFLHDTPQGNTLYLVDISLPSSGFTSFF